LDSRISDGLQIRLLWDAGDGGLWVSVLDTRRGGSFSVAVGPDDAPLDVFHHPFAYAALHGVASGQASERPALAPAG
jgi:hypothetical protein